MIRHIGAGATFLLVALVIWMGTDLIIRGSEGFHLRYLIDPPSDLGRSGGIGPMLVSTMMVVFLGTVLACLVSLPAAIVYTQVSGRSWLKQSVHALLDIGVGIPRIVWGLFGGIFFGGILGFGFSLITGILTLACLLAPILATGFISGLQAVDPSLRKQCDSLGIPPWISIWTQIVPAARPALVASVALAVGRGFGDAAALMFTAGITTELPQSLWDPGATLAVHIFQLLVTVPGGQKAAYTAAAVLFCITFIIQVGIASTNRSEGLSR